MSFHSFHFLSSITPLVQNDTGRGDPTNPIHGLSQALWRGRHVICVTWQVAPLLHACISFSFSFHSSRGAEDGDISASSFPTVLSYNVGL